MINLNVPYIAQNYEFDCWFAALRMIVKFRYGQNAEPVGHPAAALEGLSRQSKRDAIKARATAEGIAPGSYEYRQRLKLYPPRGINLAEFQQLAGHNGLVAPLLPQSYKTNQAAGWTGDRLETLLRLHGPIWCAFGYGHIVVLKGIAANGDTIVHNPQGNADEAYPIANFNNLLDWGPFCIMYMPATPNQSAFQQG
jgi:ABC-type bacteriocin/lantibiotic exporter with double-glycine peptidase domain